jgi:hypothetical protein
MHEHARHSQSLEHHAPVAEAAPEVSGHESFSAAGPLPAPSMPIGGFGTTSASDQAFGEPGKGQGAMLTQAVEVKMNGHQTTLAVGTFVEVIAESGGQAHVRVFSGHQGALAFVPLGDLHKEPSLDEVGKHKNQDQGERYEQYGGILWHGAPRASDVDQGSVGDCWLMSSSAAIAENNPHLIMGLFAPHTPNQTHYKVTLHQKQGNSYKPVTLTVDTEFPSYTKGVYASSPSSDGQDSVNHQMTTASRNVPLWPMLLEKALGQLHGLGAAGGYEALDQGNWPSIAMEAITGKPATDDFNYNENALAKIKSLHGAGQAVCCSTRGDKAAAAAQKHYNFVDAHAYFLKAIEGDMLVFGNPWGHDEPRRIPGSAFWSVFDAISGVKDGSAPGHPAHKTQTEHGGGGGGSGVVEGGGIA